jgi:hypothetical protein
VVQPITFEKPDYLIDSYESACKYLGRDNDYVTCFGDDKHSKAIIAIFKLVTIAEAWNKQDDFVPDFSNRNQYKYFPWFQYNNDVAGFVYARTDNAATYASASFGSRLCFKTESRAKQFGVQFIELWNYFLLFK